MNYYIGIDIGTTASKAVAFSERGEVLASYANGYPMQHPHPEYSEQAPEEIFSAIIKGIHQVVNGMMPAQPLAVSFSAAMHSLIVVDENGGPLTQCIIWADNRAAALAESLKSKEEGSRFYQLTGVPIHAMSPLCKLLWFKENEASVFEKAFKFISIKEYVWYRLFNTFNVDTSIASATGLLNGNTLQWDETILKYLGINANRLSEVVKPTYHVPYEDRNGHLPELKNVPFVMGASDGALSNLGGGATDSHTMAVNIGTSSAARVISHSFSTDSLMRTFCYHVQGSRYITGGASNNGAVVMEWLRENVLQTKESFAQLFQQAAGIVPGCEGLIMLPYILGERAPIWDAAANGVFFGLHKRHGKAHLIRAAMEGVAFSVYSIAKIVMENSHITAIHATGGFAKSDLWLQILADVCGVKVVVNSALESTALGAVMLAAAALGTELEVHNKVLASCQPNTANSAVYGKRFEQYERLYNLLKQEMKNV